ncbi:MAG TPA: ParB/RepB/Spo0J family partition protein, partial [Candidatus Paceibacterota bacterium]
MYDEQKNAQAFYGNAIFWVEVEKIKPNPFQPRKEFDEARLRDLASSIRQYGVLQPLVVTRKEVQKADGGLATEYELIAGERRLRASKLAGLVQVPVIIRTQDESDRTKLELAIIENLQREELNPIDRAKAFDRLVKEFGFKHVDIAPRVGKSRVYVSNTIRLLMLPDEMQTALAEGRISEGHTRPLLMLVDRPQEQQTLFREIMLKKINVRDAENIARRIAFDRVRKKEYMYAPEVLEMERELSQKLGTRVMIESRENGGKLSIDFFGEDDLRILFAALGSMMQNGMQRPGAALENATAAMAAAESAASQGASPEAIVAVVNAEMNVAPEVAVDDRSKQ